MKILSLIPVMMFYSMTSFGQNQRSEVFLRSDDKLACVQNATFLAQSQDNCLKYKKMKKTGTIVASVGGGLLGAGAILIFVGIPFDIDKYSPVKPVINQNAAEALIINGSLSAVLGIAGISTGVPLAVIGNKRLKKYCGESKRSVSLSTNGLNLALNF